MARRVSFFVALALAVYRWVAWASCSGYFKKSIIVMPFSCTKEVQRNQVEEVQEAIVRRFKVKKSKAKQDQPSQVVLQA